MAAERPLALVTGASAGLGSEFSHQLASQGWDLLLTARREDRLQALARQLIERYGIQAEVLPADLTCNKDVDRLVDAIRSNERLELLVNNAGFGLYGYFWELDQKSQVDMIMVHDIASVRLVYAALPAMIAHRRGGLIQVASMAAFISGRKSVMYNTTKSFLVAFSQSLQAELKGSGVHVQALCPGFTVTEFHDTPPMDGYNRNRIPGWMWLRGRDVVALSLREIQKGSSVVIPGVWYRLGGFFLRTALIGGVVRRLGI